MKCTLFKEPFHYLRLDICIKSNITVADLKMHLFNATQWDLIVQVPVNTQVIISYAKNYGAFRKHPLAWTSCECREL